MHVLVGGGTGREQIIEAIVYPGQPQMEQSIEPIEIPPHANALKSLNYQPFSGTFDHPAADWIPAPTLH